MTTRVFRYRQSNIRRSDSIAMTPTQGNEVATRVIINSMHVKFNITGSSLTWSNFWAHLYLLPAGFNPNSGNAEWNKIPVASMVIHSNSLTVGDSFKLAPTITLRSGSEGSGTSSSVDNVKYLVSSYSDSLSFSDGVIRDRIMLSGSGYYAGAGVFVKWNVPEYFYMGPGDSLQVSAGGYYPAAAQQILDTNTTYFSGTDLDLVCIADSN